MDAISAISQRISEIHSLIGAVAPSSVATASSAAAASTATTASAALALLGSSASSASFEELLTAATSQTGTLTAASTQLNADGVPVALAGYGNGRIPAEALSPITGSSQRMWGPAAEQLNRLMADASADGVTIGVTDGYRDYDTQVSLAASKGLYSQGGLAAEPGTSQHGWGLAADLSLDSTALAWMREHAADYGFVEAVPRESWHWEFQPGA
ncbi:M15 family metallopeptidase [Demequina iriomotensis]|uniref:M15 family metallopeptidase n=1 Tax=Demequina iriomotensis TaxID=1536641 RepID=UPI00078144C9|nr:M15 family metallopeptidase [Demequina iriomotensis]